MTILVFDGSFEGILSAVFDKYERKFKDVILESESKHQPQLLADIHHVQTTDEKAGRVWNALQKKLSVTWQQRLYCCFLSELEEAFQNILEFICYCFDSAENIENNYGHPALMALSKIDKSVSRERHRMKAFIRFEETADGLFYAGVEPDFNVIPLVIYFFKNRYADQKWIIYDLKRNYGFYYDLNQVTEVVFEHAPKMKDKELLHEKENLYALLWNDYFKSTNIPARKNMKLHLQHVPRRYWKYLTEKRMN